LWIDTCYDDLDVFLARLERVLLHKLRSSMGRDDFHFKANAEFLQRLSGFFHDLRIGLTAHNDGDFSAFAHSLKSFRQVSAAFKAAFGVFPKTLMCPSLRPGRFSVFPYQ
jgi:hypothetical protein